MMRRLALGTVQFGQCYGVANQSGQVQISEVESILAYAKQIGVNTLDTAVAYGDSERVLGKLGVSSWKVVTKLPAVPAGTKDVKGFALKTIESALVRMQTEQLEAVLFHDADQLLGDSGAILYEALLTLKVAKKIKKIGVSIYAPEILDTLCARYAFDLVQAPFNLLDRRLEHSGWLQRLSQAGVEVHVRSVFLQGLLLMSHTARPAKFNRWQGVWQHFAEWLNAKKITPLQACLRFALSHDEVSRVLVGVDSLTHLKEIYHAASDDCDLPPKSLAIDDLDLLHPFRWGAL